VGPLASIGSLDAHRGRRFRARASDKAVLMRGFGCTGRALDVRALANQWLRFVAVVHPATTIARVPTIVHVVDGASLVVGLRRDFVVGGCACLDVCGPRAGFCVAACGERYQSRRT